MYRYRTALDGGTDNRYRTALDGGTDNARREPVPRRPLVLEYSWPNGPVFSGRPVSTPARPALGQARHDLNGPGPARGTPWAVPGPGGWARGPARHGPITFIFIFYTSIYGPTCKNRLKNAQSVK